VGVYTSSFDTPKKSNEQQMAAINAIAKKIKMNLDPLLIEAEPKYYEMIQNQYYVAKRTRKKF